MELGSGAGPARGALSAVAAAVARGRHVCHHRPALPAGAAINIGMQLGRSTVRHQDVTVAALRSLIRAERRVTFLLVLAAHAQGQ